jgi:hypothetical protein
MGKSSPPAPGVDASSRHLPAGVHDVFAPGERVCSRCGARSLDSSRTCPACGMPYVARRPKPLGTRRARLIAAAAVIVLFAVIGGGVALLTPGINSAKRAHAAATRRADAAATAALIARETAEQQLHLATGRERDPGAPTPPPVRVRARSTLVRELEQAITADARARVRAGALTGPILFTACSPYPKGPVPPQVVLAERVGAYGCLAVNTPIKNAKGTVGELGDPFWARIDFATSRLAWCKINPRPGEQALGSAAPSVPLAPACDLRQPASRSVGVATATARAASPPPRTRAA